MKNTFFTLNIISEPQKIQFTPKTMLVLQKMMFFSLFTLNIMLEPQKIQFSTKT